MESLIKNQNTTQLKRILKCDETPDEEVIQTAQSEVVWMKEEGELFVFERAEDEEEKSKESQHNVQDDIKTAEKGAMNRDSRQRGNPSLLEGTNESEIDTHHSRRSPRCVQRDEDGRVEMGRAGRR